MKKTLKSMLAITLSLAVMVTFIPLTASVACGASKAGTPKNLQITYKELTSTSDFENGDVEISWSKSKGAKGYKVYFKSDKKFKAIGTTKKPSYVIKGLQEGKTYAVKVKAYKKKGSSSTYSKYSKAITIELNKEDLSVMTKTGNMVGTEENGVHSYLGIHFAKAATGESGLRWKKPEAMDPTSEDVDATEFSKSALQNEWHSELVLDEDQSEDCLALNIWSKDPSVKGKAVYVFIHGGAHILGTSNSKFYYGQDMVENHGDDVVFVSLNYRLNNMGLIDLSSIPDGEKYKAEDFKDAPWLCLYDNIAALQWIQENIEAFGGDPENVTIAGESAGGAQVSLLPLMEDSNVLKGSTGTPLFKRIIQESGSSAFVSTNEECQAEADVIKALYSSEEEIDKSRAPSSDQYGTYGTDGVTLDDLMALDAKEIQNLNHDIINHSVYDYGEYGKFLVGPSILGEIGGAQNYPQCSYTGNRDDLDCPFDWCVNKAENEDKNVLTPRDLIAAYKDIKGVDILIGTTQDEYNYWVGEFENRRDAKGNVLDGPDPNKHAYKVFNHLMGNGNKDIALEWGEIESKSEEVTGAWNKEGGIRDILENNGVLEEFEALVKDECKALSTSDPAKGSEYDTCLAARAYTEWGFRAPAILQAKTHENASSGKTYMYYWEHPSTLTSYGACHAVELPYFYGCLDHSGFAGDADSQLKIPVQEAIVNFAVSGNPSAEGQPEWKEYGQEKNTMVIKNTAVSRTWSLEKNLDNELVTMMAKDGGLFDQRMVDKFKTGLDK